MTPKRPAIRFDKAFPVWISHDDFGESQGIARDVSATNVVVEMAEPLPLGSDVRVHFPMVDCVQGLVAHGLVRRHYFLQFSDAGGPRVLTGMGVRITGFDAPSATPEEGPIHARTLH